MKNQDKLIDDYVKGMLSDTDKAVFEKEMANNKAIYEEVQFRKTIVHHFKFEQIKQTIEQAKVENEQDAKAKLETVKSTVGQARLENIASKKKRIRLYRRIALAAAFLVIMTGAWFASVFQQEPLLTNIEITESQLQEVAANNKAQIKTLIEKANKAIEQAQFDLVLSITNQLRKEEGFETDEILQNECYIYVKQKNYTKANRQVDGIKNLELQNEVRWKLSQLYLDIGENNLAKQQLQSINEEPYKTKAIKKLKKLNEQ